jgi:hypothetical protein
MASLTPDQTAKVAAWVAAGATLSQVQSKLSSELNVSMTYMDVRFLVDDLNLALVEKEEPKKEEPVAEAVAEEPAADGAAPAAGGAVSVEVDTIARPGMIVSGHVKFSDGQIADWFIDEAGRPGMSARVPGYRPTESDMRDFQQKLDVALRQLGF